MPKACRQVSTQEQDDAPLLASELVSRVSDNKLMDIVNNYRVPPDYALYDPLEACRADQPRLGFVALSEHILKAGGTIPLHSFFVAVLNYFDLAPLQLAPNGWLTLSCLFIGYMKLLKRAPTATEVHFLYNLMPLHNSKGFYYLQKDNNGASLIEGSVSNLGAWKRDFFFVEGPLSVREDFRTTPKRFAEPSVVGLEAKDMRWFLNAELVRKEAVRLFTIKNLNRHKLSPVSDPKLLWTISGSTKMKETLAEPCPDDDEEEEGLEEAPLDRGGFHQPPPSPGGCPPRAPYDPDIASHSQDQQDIPGCSIYPDPEGHDAFTQAPHDIGSPRADFVGLAVPPL
ncbi:uncharacterized protein LOC133780686 [Humulus lupulus]|uniref:uncharacterized protein LOC133780686 n=1 Tax=Humulus lupulus TaxID=3486 RepID=UPI002B417164|nr:uncharacterized protein LOC133780686 [Humulus lupulus]